MSNLSSEEIEKARKAFTSFDKDGSGAIDLKEIAEALRSMGVNPSEEELFQMLTLVDEDNSGEIEFPEFLKVLQNQKSLQASREDEEDTVGAFIALGGNQDKSGEERDGSHFTANGFVHAEKLRLTVKDFGLTIDIDKLIKDSDQDGSGMISYAEFKKMMSN